MRRRGLGRPPFLPVRANRSSRRQPPQVLWGRVAAAGVAAVVALAVVIWFLVFIVQAIIGKMTAEEPTEVELGPPRACTPREVLVQAQAPSSVARGASVTVNVSLATSAKVPCLLESGAATLGMVITTGDRVVFDTIACTPPEAPTRPLLVRAGDTWNGALTWDGVNRDAACAPQDKAHPGTYRIQLRHAGADVADPFVFTVQ